MTASSGALSPYLGTRVLVLGASGFVGRWVARALRGSGCDLHLAVRDPVGASALFERYEVTGDIHRIDAHETEGVATLIRVLAPDVVFNLVGYGVDPTEKRAADQARAEALNAVLPAAVIRALATARPKRWQGRALVHAGSVLEYGPIGGALSEGIEPRPTGLYAVTKLAGTRALGRTAPELGVDAVTARLCQLYGPGEHPTRLLPTLIAAAAGAPLEPLSEGSQTKDFTYIADVAHALLRLGTTTGHAGEIVNVATGRLTSVREFALTAARILRLPEAALRFEKPVPDNELHHGAVVVDRLRHLVGWVPDTTVDVGIRRTIAFEAAEARSHGR